MYSDVSKFYKKDKAIMKQIRAKIFSSASPEINALDIEIFCNEINFLTNCTILAVNSVVMSPDETSNNYKTILIYEDKNN